MNAIIFGANGQDGYYLSNLLTKLSIDVFPIIKNNFDISDTHDIKYKIDLSDYISVENLIKDTKPSFIFHFAANSTTAHSAVFENHQTICTGTLNILEAVRCHSPLTKVFISGSGLQFVNNGNPIKETDQFEARDAYSVSRIHSVYAARYYRNLGLNIYVGYFFNHDSLRRSERHMAKKITEFVKGIARGNNQKLEIGNINVVKEWAYAGDIVQGVWTLVNQEKIFEAVIGSGLGYSIKDWLKICFDSIGKDWEQHIIINKKFKPDYKCLVSDPNTLLSLGWKPSVTFEELAFMMLNDII